MYWDEIDPGTGQAFTSQEAYDAYLAQQANPTGDIAGAGVTPLDGNPYGPPQPAVTYPGGDGTGPGSPVGPPADGDWRKWFNDLVAGKAFNQQTLLDHEPILNQNGLHLTPENTNHERTKIQLPDGTWVRVGFGGAGWEWVPQGGPNTAPATPNLGALTSPGILDPFTGQPPPGWTTPDAFPYYQQPTMDEATSEPGYAMGVSEGERALEQSAAGQGLARTGGTLKDILNFGRSAANQQYTQVDQRKRDTYNTNYRTYNDQIAQHWKEYLAGHDIFEGNQQKVYDRSLGIADLSLRAQ